MSIPATQYRYFLYDPTRPLPERPVQAFFSDATQGEDWTRHVLKAAGKGSIVYMFELKEILLGAFHFPEKTDGKEQRNIAPYPIPSSADSK